MSDDADVADDVDDDDDYDDDCVDRSRTAIIRTALTKCDTSCIKFAEPSNVSIIYATAVCQGSAYNDNVYKINRPNNSKSNHIQSARANLFS